MPLKLKKILPKSATVCLEGYKISKNGKCIKDKKYSKVRKILPKSATVCLEGYKISKNGKCIKDKKYSKVRKILPKSATVCLEGYKISKNGKCIKDKKYKIVISSLPNIDLPIQPVLCMDGYTKNQEGVCVKMPVVCIPGFKINSDGKCVEDVKETLVIANVPSTQPFTEVLKTPEVSAQELPKTIEIINEAVAPVVEKTPEDIKTFSTAEPVVEVKPVETQQITPQQENVISTQNINELQIVPAKETQDVKFLNEQELSKIREPKLEEAEKYIKQVFKDYGVTYDNCKSFDEILEVLRKQCVKEIGYETSMPLDKCVNRKLKLADSKYNMLSHHLLALNCKLGDKIMKNFSF